MGSFRNLAGWTDPGFAPKVGVPARQVDPPHAVGGGTPMSGRAERKEQKQMDYSELLTYDRAPLAELDEKVDRSVNQEVATKKAAIESARQKKLKKALKNRKIAAAGNN